MLSGIDRSLLPATVDEYISELLIVKARSEATVTQYITDLYLFFCYLEKFDTTLSPGQDRKFYDLSHIDINYLNKITLKDINNFLIFCSSDRSNSTKTRARSIFNSRLL